MDHVAIMHDKFLKKVLNRTKTIESRWSVNKIIPFGKVFTDDNIYFKKSGADVIAKAKVDKVYYFYTTNIDNKKVWLGPFTDLQNMSDKKDAKLNQLEFYCSNYESQLGFNIKEIPNYRKKRYATFIHIKNLHLFKKSFSIDKSGFGLMAGWLLVGDIENVRRD